MKEETVLTHMSQALFGFFAALFILLPILTIGCDEPRYRRCDMCEKRERMTCDCEKIREPGDWLVTLKFKGHDNKEQVFSVKVSKPNDHPDFVFEIRGVRPDGVVEYFYSEKEPEKEKTGLLKFNEINGALKMVDYTSVTLGLIPCTPQPLDPGSQKVRDYYDKYYEQRSKCEKCGWDFKQSHGKEWVRNQYGDWVERIK